jgi:phosphoglycerate dehydrogenase-like enzyme
VTESQISVLVASPLEVEEVERIRAAFPGRVRVVHEPELIPQPRYVADHSGTRPALGADGLAHWRELLREADVLFDFDWYEPAALARNAPNLRWVQATSSGIGEYLRRLGLDASPITFTNCAGIHAIPLAEWVVLGLLYLIKDVPRLRVDQARHHWERYTARSLSGRRVLVVGLGGVGREVARTLAALGVEVWGLRRSDAPAPESVARLVTRSELRTALGSVDALVLACPYTPETHRLIGAAELAALPAGALIVNIARGQVVDETALTAALESGQLGGAALDVFEVEPLPETSRLWDLPNVLISPHSVSTVDRENRLIVDLFIDNLGRFLDGRPLRNVYDRARGY